MKAFLDSIALAFESMGVHPVLGAFLAGAVIAFVFARRRTSPSDPEVIEPPALAAHRARPLQLETETATSHATATATAASHTGHGTVTYKGHVYDFPPEVMVHIQAGNKVQAIKVMRSKTGIDLTTAKQIVDRIAALPAKR